MSSSDADAVENLVGAQERVVDAESQALLVVGVDLACHLCKIIFEAVDAILQVPAAKVVEHLARRHVEELHGGARRQAYT